MKSTKINSQIQKLVETSCNQLPQLPGIVQAIDKAGGRALLVGGAVRDILLGVPSKDIDIEIHGITLDVLEQILKDHGKHVDTVGKVYGVLRVPGLDVDWSIPRSDTAGRKPTVHLDPHLNLRQAFIRRDLTINALGIDLITYELIDPFNGIHDLQQRILRTPDPKFFIEDPLRLFRVMQFIGRFGFTPDQELNAVCSTMNIRGVSIERIEAEFEKLFFKSNAPSQGIRWLHTIGRLKDILPELYALIDVPQNPVWHPEGDVFEHTMQAIDAAAGIEEETHEATLTLRYAALCHDLGKAVTTQKIDGVWRSRGHDVKGVPIAKRLLKRITKKKQLIADVAKLVRYHMSPGQFVAANAKIYTYKKLARKLAPTVSLQLLADLYQVDLQGRNAKKYEPLRSVDEKVFFFKDMVRNAHILTHPEEPILQGRDLLDVIAPGPQVGQLVKRAYTIQIKEGIQDKEILKARVLTEQGIEFKK